jgi:hypothetical protein
MTTLVAQYFEIMAEDGPAFDNPRLEALRDRMTEQEAVEVRARLTREAHARQQEADDLERFAEMKFGAVNDN